MAARRPFAARIGIFPRITVSEPIVISEYNPQWLRMFEEERARIVAALYEISAQVEHMGSTSVPGLAAKPIIDIMVIVENEHDAIRAITPLVLLDYECRGEMEIPGRLYFRRGMPRSHQIHLYPSGHVEIERHLLFRDYLRTHSDTAQEYAKLKYLLAGQYRNDRLGYTDAKTQFVCSIEQRARAERAAGRL